MVDSQENQLRHYRGKRKSTPYQNKNNAMRGLRIRSPSPIASSWESLDMPIQTNWGRTIVSTSIITRREVQPRHIAYQSKSKECSGSIRVDVNISRNYTHTSNLVANKLSTSKWVAWNPNVYLAYPKSLPLVLEYRPIQGGDLKVHFFGGIYIPNENII